VHGIAECRMRRHVVDESAIDVDRTPVAQGIEMIRPGFALSHL
jgi:hypothetical protein